MLTNYTIGVPGYPVHGMPMQTGVPIVAQQAMPSVAQTQLASSNTSGLLEFSQMLADTKVGMSKIDLKLDEVMKRVDSIKESSVSKAIVPVSNPDTPVLIDPNVVLHSITKVVEESRALKQELLDRDARIEALNQKSRQLLASNQSYVEQSQQIMAQKSDSIHSLSSANNSHIIKLQGENSALKAKADEYKRKLESRSLEMGEQESDVNEMRKRNELLNQKMNQARNKFREKETEIEELKGEIEKLHREAGKQKLTRHTAQKEATDLNETIEELRENVRSEKQSKKKIQSKLTRLDEELTEVKSDRDRLTSVIEDKRKKQQSEKNKIMREIDEIKRGYEDEISVLKSQMQQSTGPTQADLAKLEASWKRKMQEGIARSVSELEDKCEELEASEQKLKSQVQRLEKKVTTLSLENSNLQQENGRVMQELDEFESVKNRDATSQLLIDKQNVMIEQFNLRENELRNDFNESREKERDSLEQIQMLGEKIRELESHQQISDSDEWRNRVRHAMNKFYASVQVRFNSQNTFTGIQVQEILIEAIKVETERVLKQDVESTGSTETEDSADEANTPINSLTNNSIGVTENQLNSSQSPNQLDSNSPIPPNNNVTISPIRGNSPNLQRSADRTVKSSQLGNTRVLSLEFEDSVDNTNQSESSPVTNVDICHTVVPLHSDMDSAPLSSDSTPSTDQHTPQTYDASSLSPVNQSGGTLTSSPPLFQSPISSPIPIQTQTQSGLNQSPNSSPIPMQNETESALDQSPISSPTTSKAPIELSPISSPIPYQHVSSHITISDPIPTDPDISENIQEYSQTPHIESPRTQSPASTPPSDRSYKHVPSHSASPPPMDLHTDGPTHLAGDESLTTGNFSPDLIDKHFSTPLSDDKISSLDAILGSSFPSLQENTNVKPQTKPYSPDTESKTTAASDVNPESNPLLDGSGDSESEIFFELSKKKEPPPIEPKATQKSLFEDSDDDLDWINN